MINIINSWIALIAPLLSRLTLNFALILVYCLCYTIMLEEYYNLDNRDKSNKKRMPLLNTDNGA